MRLYSGCVGRRRGYTYVINSIASAPREPYMKSCTSMLLVTNICTDHAIYIKPTITHKGLLNLESTFSNSASCHDRSVLGPHRL